MTDHTRWADSIDASSPILVTGAAGFIGYFLAERLLRAGLPVVGFDNMNAYYDPALKRARLSRLREHPSFIFVEADLAAPGAVANVVRDHSVRIVVNLAAQAGVRHSITHPQDYGTSNLTGFLNVLEACRQGEVEHLVYASSSSVYGGNTRLPFSVRDNVDHPVSLYAATKKANEMMAHAYSHLYGLPATGLRFFTVYGPFGRPDMAYFKFTRAILAREPIQVFNNGLMERDFTYVDDIVEGIVRLLPLAPVPDPAFDKDHPDPGRSWAPHRIFNIGNSRREKLMDMIDTLEALLGCSAIRDLQPMQPGDVVATWADVSDLEAVVGYRPDTPLETGLRRFVDWYLPFHGHEAG